MNFQFLAPKPIEDGSDLPNQWAQFKKTFEQFMIASEKDTAADKVK